MEKKAVLVVSFGTSHTDARIKSIDRIEAAVAAALPDRRFYRAWTSGMIIRRLLQRDGVTVPTVDEAIGQMKQDGVEDLLVQPTHLLNGIENDIMKEKIQAAASGFARVRFGAPLLSCEEDNALAVQAIVRAFPDLQPDEALVLMGHGTEHYTNPVYAALDYRFKEMGYGNFFMGTVEAYPSVTDVLKLLKDRPEIRRVTLAPFMVTAGDHAKNDMAGDGEDSWQQILAKAGYEVNCVLRGLGEYPDIVSIFVKHAMDALKEEAV